MRRRPDFFRRTAQLLGGFWVVRTMDIVLATAITLGISLLAWRVSVVLNSPLALCALLAAPLLVSTRSVLAGLASLLAVTAVALALLPPNGPLHDLAFIFSGASLLGPVIYSALVAGTRLSEARAAVEETRYRQANEGLTLDAAGVCQFTVSRHLTWRAVNPAALRAFGFESAALGERDGRLQLEDEAVTSLMHSGSREAWRELLESVKAELGGEWEGGASSAQLHPRTVTLFGQDGRPSTYLFHITATPRGDLVFIGVPAGGGPGHLFRAWVNGLVDATDAPAVALLPDGSVAAANRSFTAASGPLFAGSRIFECRAVQGLNEASFAAQVWGGAGHASVAMNDIVLAGRGGAKARRLSPTAAPHMEVLLLSL